VYDKWKKNKTSIEELNYIIDPYLFDENEGEYDDTFIDNNAINKISSTSLRHRSALFKDGLGNDNNV
jgi:hypothetical protein